MRWLRRLGIAAAGLLIAVGILAGLSYWQVASIIGELHAGAKQSIVDEAKKELGVEPRRSLVGDASIAPAGDETILLLGSDRRYGERDRGRADTIILARVAASEHRIAVLSIPRDLLVDIPGHGQDRINAAYELGGERLLIRTVREAFGVRIDHFVEVNFRGFDQVVNALGGVYLPIDQRYFNRNVGTPETDYSNIDLRPGYQKLNGSQALAFVRFRHTDSDFYRAARQQLFLREAMRQALADKFDLLRIRGLLRAFARATVSDLESVGQVWRLIRAVEETKHVVRFTVAAQDVVLGGGDYLEATTAERRSVVRRWYGEAGTTTPRGPARHPPPPRATLVPDGGEGRALLAGFHGLQLCAPMALPPGYFWPSDAAREYRLAGHPAVAAYATAGSGRSVLWMMTGWDDPPILSSPSGTARVRGRTIELWHEDGRLRQVAWQLGKTRVWITNTLRDELTSSEMLALAATCRPLR
ncbi:MAG TPA: LCP family protein [Gaiellaceae bacterium]|nr:LCP family protein [Gaiellaceae bacterium]